jgi:hypothetical protein
MGPEPDRAMAIVKAVDLYLQNHFDGYRLFLVEPE